MVFKTPFWGHKQNKLAGTIYTVFVKMVRHCAWGTCTNDERYPEKMKDCTFIPFPRPKTDFDKCLRWIKACGRPHDQLNVSRINKHKVVCSKVRDCTSKICYQEILCFVLPLHGDWGCTFLLLLCIKNMPKIYHWKILSLLAFCWWVWTNILIQCRLMGQQLRPQEKR